MAPSACAQRHGVDAVPEDRVKEQSGGRRGRRERRQRRRGAQQAVARFCSSVVAELVAWELLLRNMLLHAGIMWKGCKLSLCVASSPLVMGELLLHALG